MIGCISSHYCPLLMASWRIIGPLAQIWMPYQERFPTKQEGRVLGIGGSLFLLLFCYWITTLKDSFVTMSLQNPMQKRVKMSKPEAKMSQVSRISQEVPPMMRETQKDGPKDLRPISLEELKKHSHQADEKCREMQRNAEKCREMQRSMGIIFGIFWNILESYLESWDHHLGCHTFATLWGLAETPH